MKYVIMDCWGADAGLKGTNMMMSTACVEADSPALAVLKVAPKWENWPLEQKDFGNGAVVVSPDPDLVDDTDGIGLLVVHLKSEQAAPVVQPIKGKTKTDSLIDQFMSKSR